MSKRPNRKKGIYVRLLDNISSNYGEKQDASYISCKKCVWYIVLWTYPKNQTMNKMKHWKLTWFNIFLFIHSLWSVILEWCGELQENWTARIILIHNIKYLQKLTISLFFFFYLLGCFVSEKGHSLSMRFCGTNMKNVFAAFGKYGGIFSIAGKWMFNASGGVR